MKQSMGARMIFHCKDARGNDTLDHYICFGGACDPKAEVFNCYSGKHAEDAGWRYSADPKLLPSPGIICPDCLREKIEATDITDAFRDDVAALELSADGKVKLLPMRDVYKPPESEKEG
jgi:hypothetical protein